MKTIDIPLIINGEYIYDGEKIELHYENDTIVRIPKLTPELFKAIIANRTKLSDLKMADTTHYLSNAGKSMLTPHNPQNDIWLENVSAVSGYSPAMIERDHFVIGEYIVNRNVLYDLVEAEFGDCMIMDEWVRRQVTKIRAFPKGRVFHILVGNVPLASNYSIIRSILTKNQTILKIPSRDPLSSFYFTKNLIDSNPKGSPISKSISLFYIKPDDDLMNELINASDMICAWGKGSSIQSIKKKIPQGRAFLEFGPKRSYSIIFSDYCSLKTAALRMAHDVSVYDQEACFNPQRLFFIGSKLDEFIEHLKDALDLHSVNLPRGKYSPDSLSHIERIKLVSTFQNGQVIEGGSWNIIICPPDDVVEHPLGRTLFVHPIDELQEVEKYVDDECQTVSIFPYAQAEEVGNLLCSKGLDRVCELGLVSYPREGFTHDSMYALHYFVRLAHIDESVKYVYKFGDKKGLSYYMCKAYGIDTSNEKEVSDFVDVLYETSNNW